MIKGRYLYDRDSACGIGEVPEGNGTVLGI